MADTGDGSIPLVTSMGREDDAMGVEAAAESLSARAYREIEDLIVRLDLSPGQPISEGELGSRLGIGRTPIREALQRLAREGLVRVSPRRGIFVTDIRVDAQLRLLEVRRSIERLMAARAARLAEAAQRDALGKVATEMREAGNRSDDVAFLKLDREFNTLTASVAGNEFAAAAISLSAALSRRFWFRYYRTVADLPLTCALHADVADAIAAGDQAGAAAASDRLMDHIERFTRTVFEHVS